MTVDQLKGVKVGHLIGARVNRMWITAKVTAISDGKLSFFETTDDHEFEMTCDIDSKYFRENISL